MVFPAAEIVYQAEQVIEQTGLVKDLIKELLGYLTKILNLVSEYNHITKSAMTKQIETSTITIDNHIKTLKNKNVLQRVGAKKRGIDK
jgi:predicted HTH transcriptional regulator